MGKKKIQTLLHWKVLSSLLILSACSLCGKGLEEGRWAVSSQGSFLSAISFRPHCQPREGSTSTLLLSFNPLTAAPNPSGFPPPVEHLRQCGCEAHPCWFCTGTWCHFSAQLPTLPVLTVHAQHGLCSLKFSGCYWHISHLPTPLDFCFLHFAASSPKTNL